MASAAVALRQETRINVGWPAIGVSDPVVNDAAAVDESNVPGLVAAIARRLILGNCAGCFQSGDCTYNYRNIRSHRPFIHDLISRAGPN